MNTEDPVPAKHCPSKPPKTANKAENKIRVLEGYVQRYLSAILFNVDVNRLAEVKDLMKRAMENHSRNRMIFLLAHDSAHYGEFCLCKGDLAMAEEKLSKAIEKSEASKK